MASPRRIRKFEHEVLKTGPGSDELSQGELQLLQRYCSAGTPYFSLIHHGVKFNSYVGVLQVGNLTIEVLPKADNGNDDKESWQKFLISMLRAAGIFPDVTSTASLRLKHNSILDLYMQLFLNEVRYLVQTGLVRKYRKTEGNSTALKGSLLFAQNIRHNLTHAERFYVRHTVYDRNNRYNTILVKTVALIQHISRLPTVRSEAAALLLDLPECKDVRVSETLFNGLVFDRKTAAYQKAIGMAKLLLLRFHPDVRKGANEVLALMFDMNQLWEKYVFRKLRRELDGTKFLVSEQVRNDFWQPEDGYMRMVRPDIVVYDATSNRTIAVLDTKWKRLTNDRLDDADLKQMLVYNLYNGCNASALVYPASKDSTAFSGKFSHRGSSCCALFVPLGAEANDGLQLDLKPLLSFITNCAALCSSDSTMRIPFVSKPDKSFKMLWSKEQK